MIWEGSLFHKNKNHVEFGRSTLQIILTFYILNAKLTVNSIVYYAKLVKLCCTKQDQFVKSEEIMQYRVYTKTRNVIFPVVFKCEHCGKYNVILNPFTIQASYNDKGTFTQKGVKKREQQADEILKDKQNNLYDKIVEETNKRNVKNTGYLCSCSHCNTVPKWSKFRNKVLDKICNIISVLALMIFAFLCLPIIEGDFSTIHNFLIPIGMLAVVYIPRFVLYTIKTLKIKALSEEYMPIVCENANHLTSALTKLGYNEGTDVSPFTPNAAKKDAP